MCLLLISLLVTSATVLPELRRVSVTDEVSLLLPTDFQRLPDEALARRYPSYRKPVAVYSDPAGRADVGYNRAPSNFAYADLPILQSFYRANLQQLYDSVTFLREDIRAVNGQDFVVFELLGTVAEQEETVNVARGPRAPVRRYVYVQYTLAAQQVHIFNFNCPAANQDKWQPAAAEMLNSVKMRKKKR